MLYINRINIYSICWCAVSSLLVRTRQFGPLIETFSPLVQPLLWPVLGARDQPFPGWCTVSFLRLICVAIGDMLSIFWMSLRHAALYLCWRQGWLYLYWNYYYAQLYWTKLIIAYEYCWYYRVLSDQAVFLIGVMCWFSVGAGIYHVPVLFAMWVWFSNARNTAVVTDLWQGIDCLGRVPWSMYVQ